MDNDTLKAARKKLKEAERALSDRHLEKARMLVNEICTLEYELNGQSVLERAEKLRLRIDRIKGLRISRWILVSTTVLVIGILATLVGFRINETLIELEAHVDRAKLTLDTGINLGPWKIKSVNLSGIANLNLDAAFVRVAQQFDTKTETVLKWKPIQKKDAFMLKGLDSMWSIYIVAPYLRLADLSITNGTSIILESMKASPGHLRLTASAGKVAGTLDVQGETEISCNACELVQRESIVDVEGLPIRITLPREEIDFVSSATGLKVTLMYQNIGSEPRAEIGHRIPIRKLEFTRLFGEETESSVVGDSRISWMELGGKELRVKPGDTIQINELTNFRIKQMYMTDHLVIVGYGKVGMLRTGNGPFLKNRLPSYLEWLRANNAVGLFIGSLLPVMAVILAVLYRLKILDEG